MRLEVYSGLEAFFKITMKRGCMHGGEGLRAFRTGAAGFGWAIQQQFAEWQWWTVRLLRTNPIRRNAGSRRGVFVFRNLTFF